MIKKLDYTSDITSDITSFLESVGQIKTPVIKKIEETEDVIINTNINNANLDITASAFSGISNLTNEEIKKIAEKALTSKRQSESTTSSSSDDSNDEYYSTSSDEEWVNIADYWINKVTNTVSDAVDSTAKLILEGAAAVTDKLQLISQDLSADNALAAGLRGIAGIIADGMANYQDGVSETTFGAYQESSWYGESASSYNKSFLNYFKKKNMEVARESMKIKFLSSTPLDAGAVRQSLYGSLMLGCPFLFNKLSDPGNRTLINTFIKDGRFLSLTPGMPEYHGLNYVQKDSESIFRQTKSPEAMLRYLQKNGLDRDFTNKDKRFYTFKTDYEAYFSYLETMLNAVWIKLGLAKNGETFNLFTFFQLEAPESQGGIQLNKYKDLKSQYNSSIGFFVNIASALSESIDSSQTSFGSSLADQVNTASDQYQQINYITGMGTGSATRQVLRKAGIGFAAADQLGNFFSDNFTNTKNAITGFKAGSLIQTIASTVKLGVSAVKDISKISNTQDMGALMQSFATSNGMRVVYPELWSSSNYSKNINFNFSFVSPYGDPLSIFKYVYVPFLALACFALPRQAAENGFVSPFFVRADVPGLLTSDLALISSLTWTKGGSNALWTKDGLPRAIDCSITITDLFPYLAMSKRLSFLSANPSFAVFLDSLTGMMALNDNNDENPLNDYFVAMIDRVNGLHDNTGLWNKYNRAKSAETIRISKEARESVGGTIRDYSVPWLHNSSIF